MIKKILLGLNAFSSREPVSTSLENTLEKNQMALKRLMLQLNADA